MKNVVKTKKTEKISEGATTSKMRRIVTGQSAGDEIHKLPEEQQKRLVELYMENPREAAEYLRSIIIKEKNSQFGLGLALVVAGSGMIYKASTMEPPKPPQDIDKLDMLQTPENAGPSQVVNKGLEHLGVPKDQWLSETSTGSDMKEAIAKYFGKGNFDEGLKNLTSGMSPQDAAQNIATLKSSLTGDAASQKLLDIFPPKNPGADISDMVYGKEGAKGLPGWNKLPNFFVPHGGGVNPNLID
jgi:hypothetical protein